MEKEALYISIAKNIEKEINTKYSPGDRIDPESYYQNKFNAARMTITHALQYLAGKGVIAKGNNRRYIVTNGSIDRGTEILSYTQTSSLYGFKVKSKVIDINLVEPDKKIANKLQLKNGEKVYIIHRVRYRDNVADTIEQACIVEKYAKGLEKFNFEEYSLYQILKEYYGITISKQTYNFSSVSADEDDSKYLHIQKGTPVLLTKTLGYFNFNLTPIEYTTQKSTSGCSITLTKKS